MKFWLTILCTFFIFLEAKLQNVSKDSIQQSNQFLPKLNYNEKVFKPDSNFILKNKYDYYKKETNYSNSQDNSIDEQFVIYTKMLEELENIKKNYNPKKDNLYEIEKKIEKLKLLINNLSK